MEGGVTISLVPSIPVGSSALCPQSQIPDFHRGCRCSLGVGDCSETWEGRLLSLPALEKKPGPTRGSVGMQTDPIPPLLVWGQRRREGDPTLMLTAGPCPQPEEGAAGCCVTGLHSGCARPMPCHATLALPAPAGEKEDGALGIWGGSPARCAPTLTAGSKTVTPDLFSLQLNLNPDYNQGEPPLLSPSPCGRSSVTSGFNAEPKPSQGMGELTLPGIGAAGDGVTTVPVPRPGTESTAIACLPDETLLDLLQNPWGMCHRYPSVCHGWYPAPKLHPWSGGGLVAEGCTHCPLPAHLATPNLNKLIKPELCVCNQSTGMDAFSGKLGKSSVDGDSPH